MKKILGLILLIVSFNVFGQGPKLILPEPQPIYSHLGDIIFGVPINYQYRTVRERLIAMMIDSTLHIPRYDGPPSGIRSGASTNSGALAIDTTNDVLYIGTGYAWTALTGTNIYNSNGILTGNRTLTGSNNTYGLTFDSLNNFFVKRNNISRIYMNSTESGITSGTGLNGFEANATEVQLSFNSGENLVYVKADSTGAKKKLSYPGNIHGTFFPYSLVDKSYVDSLLGNLVHYNFTGLANWDLLRYNSSSSEWVNYKSAYTGNTNPAIKALVRDTVTGQQYHTDLSTGGSDSLLYVNFQTGLTANAPVGGDNYIVFPEIGDNDINDMWVYRDGQFQHISTLYGITKSGDTLYFYPNLSDSERVSVRIIKDRPNRELTFSEPGFLLDDYPSAAAAYSLRKLRSAYAGSCIRVMRTSDNAELDIGFVSDVLDEASLLSFVGANSAVVIKWYDQSGNGLDIENASNWPYIVNSGVVITSNGNPAVDFGTDGDEYFLLFPTGFLNGATTLSYFQVAHITDFGGSNAAVLGPTLTAGVGFEVLQSSVSSRRTLLRFNGTVRNDNAGSGYQLWDDATQSLTTIFGNASSVAAYKNSSAVTLTSSAAMPSLNYNGVYSLGQYNASGNDMYGKVTELIIYTSDKTSNRTGIEGNINLFYAIY